MIDKLDFSGIKFVGIPEGNESIHIVIIKNRNMGLKSIAVFFVNYR